MGEVFSSYLETRPGHTREVLNELASWRSFYGRLLREYGIGEPEYVALYKAQAGRCEICRIARGADPTTPLAYAGRVRRPRRLGVDHNHLTGEIRALVCTGSVSANTCNRLIARYNRAALLRAVAVLSDPPPARAVLMALSREEVRR